MLYCAVKLTSDKGLVDNSNIKFPNCLVLHQKSLINPFNFSNTVLISGALRTGIHKNKSKKKKVNDNNESNTRKKTTTWSHCTVKIFD